MILVGDANLLGVLFGFLVVLLIYWIWKFLVSMYTGA